MHTTPESGDHMCVVRRRRRNEEEEEEEEEGDISLLRAGEADSVPVVLVDDEYVERVRVREQEEGRKGGRERKCVVVWFCACV